VGYRIIFSKRVGKSVGSLQNQADKYSKKTTETTATVAFRVSKNPPIAKTQDFAKGITIKPSPGGRWQKSLIFDG